MINLKSLKKKLNDKFDKIYIFPNNIYAKYINKKIKKNFVISDSYSPLKNKIIRPENIKDDKNNLLITTDKKIFNSLNLKFNNIEIFNLIIKNSDKIIELNPQKKSKKNLSTLFLKYNTDKAKYYKRLCFKDKSHNFGPIYKKKFNKLRVKNLNILEIGTYRGASTAAFHDFFYNSMIYAMDINSNLMRYKSRRINFVKMDYTNHFQVQKFKKKYNNFFDIIIDDGGHFKSHIIGNIKNFYYCLKKDSFYVIEGFGLKYNHFNDLKDEHSIFDILKFFKEKKFFKSKILKEKYQNDIFKTLKYVELYQGSYIRNGLNLSDICFLKKF